MNKKLYVKCEAISSILIIVTKNDLCINL